MHFKLFSLYITRQILFRFLSLNCKLTFTVFSASLKEKKIYFYLKQVSHFQILLPNHAKHLLRNFDESPEAGNIFLHVFFYELITNKITEKKTLYEFGISI